MKKFMVSALTCAMLASIVAIPSYGMNEQPSATNESAASQQQADSQEAAPAPQQQADSQQAAPAPVPASQQQSASSASVSAASVAFTPINFDNGVIPSYVTGQQATLQVINHTTGSKALQANYAAADYPSVKFAPSTPWNFGSNKALSFQLTNPTNKDVTFYLRVDENVNSDGVNHSIVSTAVAKAGTTQNYFLSLGSNVLDFGMRFLPPTPAGTQMSYAWGKTSLNTSNIVSFQFWLLQPSTATTLVFDNINVVNDPNSDLSYMNGIVDKYGQYSKVNWTDKIKTDQDLINDKNAEAPTLTGAPPVATSKYGGWKNGPKLAGTGHFRVQKHQGKWALVDPEGYLFFSTGLDIVRLDDMHTWVSGRENMFAGLPTRESSLGEHWRYTTVVGKPPLGQTEGWLFNHYSANLERKYGADYINQWKNVSLARFKNWGFNSLGNWSDPTLFHGKGEANKLAYVANGWTHGNHAKIPSTNGDLVADPFDPQFQTSVNNMLNQQILNYGVATDPWVIGVYVDNEISWGDPSSTQSKYILITNIMAMDAKAATSHAKRAMVAQMKTKYSNNIGALNAQWGTSFASWAALEAPFKPASISNGMVPDYSAMLKELARKYFGIVDSALTSKVPNKLNLGARFASWGTSLEVQQAAAEFVDVVSFNIYKETVNGHSWIHIGSQLDKPMIVGEYAFGATDRGMFGAGPNPDTAASSQQNRGAKYTTYMNSALNNPYFVGAHWFQYVDEPLVGRAWDGENYNLGFVDVADLPYAPMVNAAKSIHAQMYDVRW
ncbi:hypothetical protein [Paenibacillus sp. YYML68]|uniref:hypothetical protein n=1 Tax=Paenibacillus sp. YYML68 TaxID=2909250 RepID=UPI0024910FCD|nr:hypothetical protein [Paenibacillus sp. YYML68]